MIARFYRPINLETFLFHLENGVAFPPQSCLVVFDDGYLDFAEIALPILNQYSVPATVFVTQRQSGKASQLSPMDQWFLVIETWWSNLSHKKQQKDLYFDLMHGEALQAYLFARPQEQARLIEGLREKLRVDIHFDEFVKNLYLTAEKIPTLVSEDVSIGSHGYDHHVLTSLPREVVVQNFAETYRWISRFTEKKLITLSYPNGNYNHQIIQDARDAGFKAAFTLIRGNCTHTTSKYELPRYVVKNYLISILVIYLRSRISILQ